MKDTAIFLYDVTGKMAEPWLQAGYSCWIVDLQHPPAYETNGITKEGRLHKVHADLTHPWLCPVERKNFRSATPSGFARAVLQANNHAAIAASKEQAK